MTFLSNLLSFFRFGGKSGSAARPPSSPASALANLPAAAAAATNLDVGPLLVSQAAIDLIVAAEVSGRDYYTRRLAKPSWPGGSSGVTVGIGYDLGYNSAQQILTDWADLPPSQRDELARLAGLKGNKAERAKGSVAHISIPWATALKVFEQRTLPRYARMAAAAFPGLVDLHPHVQGALLSLAFNRGTSVTGASRQEVAEIVEVCAKLKRKELTSEQAYRAIASLIRRMKRLWQNKGLDGLLKRREDEAKLVESALG